MTTLASVLIIAAALVLVASFGWRLATIIRADGYGTRSSSGLPRDWAPPDLPSTPYVAKPHF